MQFAQSYTLPTDPSNKKTLSNEDFFKLLPIHPFKDVNIVIQQLFERESQQDLHATKEEEENTGIFASMLNYKWFFQLVYNNNKYPEFSEILKDSNLPSELYGFVLFDDQYKCMNNIYKYRQHWDKSLNKDTEKKDRIFLGCLSLYSNVLEEVLQCPEDPSKMSSELKTIINKMRDLRNMQFPNHNNLSQKEKEYKKEEMIRKAKLLIFLYSNQVESTTEINQKVCKWLKLKIKIEKLTIEF